jgi:hypothetical protein
LREKEKEEKKEIWFREWFKKDKKVVMDDRFFFFPSTFLDAVPTRLDSQQTPLTDMQQCIYIYIYIRHERSSHQSMMSTMM